MHTAYCTSGLIIGAPTYFSMIEGCVKKMDVFIHKIIEYYKGIRLENEIEEHQLHPRNRISIL
jgi:hypothetical protein